MKLQIVKRLGVLIIFWQTFLLGSIPVKVDYAEGKYIIRAQFEVKASQQNVWDVLTDYETIDQYISYIKKIEKIASEKDTIYQQQGVYHLFNIFPVSVHVALKIQEFPHHEIKFQDISRQDFKLYKGRWKIVPKDDLNIITFELEAIPTFLHLNIVAKKIFQKIYSEMTSEIRHEILSRHSSGK